MILIVLTIICSLLFHLPLFANAVRFVDITGKVGITFHHRSAPEKKYIVESMSGGVALIDYDNDGWLDIYFVNSLTVDTADRPRSSKSELYRNNRDGTFTDVTDRAGVGYPGWGMGACVGDYNDDGQPDLYVTCLGANKLYRNNGDGTFIEVAQEAGVADDRWSTGCAFGDYDNDGDLDLFAANYVDFKLQDLAEFGKGPLCQYRGIPVQCGPRGLPGAGDVLYRNNGDGSFTDVSQGAGVSDQEGHYGLGVIWTDVNEDGWIDLFVANDARPNFLYQNNRDGTFTDQAFLSGTAVGEDGSEQGSMGIAVGDYDRNGTIDLFVSNFSDQYNSLYRHDRDFIFTDMSFASRTAEASIPYVGWGTEFFDYDNDGWLDLLVVNGHVYPQVDHAPVGTTYAQRKLLYRNNRDGTFSEIAEQLGAALLEKRVSRGAAFGDLDNDGDIDIVINDLDGAPMVLQNDGGNRNNWIRIRAENAGSNRFAVGARVTVRAGDLLQKSEIRSGSSYISQNDLRLHFGLEDREEVDLIEVHWPGGGITRLENVSVNQEVVIKKAGLSF
ncbi:CRTAC1 family protein [Acidobacteria bacterium AH-259-O06]|nr:CRTAC1 family protein [Acidobacteria bacterium AH-259-O06]